MDSPDTSTDAELLRAWSTGRCQDSFRALVAKYLGLVQGLAHRRTGDGALADEIAQTVFARLAAKAGRITAQPTLAPWLHHCAWCETSSALRRESTRRRHMNAYADHLRASADNSQAAALHKALPHLDDALRALPRDDQRIVLMRFYEGRGLRDIASALGKTEAAVRKQGQRALEKMALRLRARGAAVSAAALAAGLGAVLSQPASAAAVALISSTAAAGGAKLTLLQQVLTLMNTKTKTALITAACMALPLVWQWQRASSMEAELAAVQKEKSLLKGQVSIFKEQRSGPTGRGGRLASSISNALLVTAAGTAGDWESALKNPDPLRRTQQLAAVMASLTAESAPDVAEVFKRLRQEVGGSQFETENRNFLRAWGRLDGAAALASLAGKEGQADSSSESLAALAGWAQSSPDNARAWLDALPPGEIQTNLAMGLIDGWSLTNFDAASAYAASLPRSTARDQFRSLLMQRALASGGVPEAQRWFTGIPGDEHNTLYKQRAFDELIAAMMTRDPSGAAEWITRMGRQEFMTGDALPELAARLASSSPSEALRWLETLGAGQGAASEKTAQSFGRVLDTWSSKDPSAAGAWLQTHSDHPAYDQMAAVHARNVAATDGATALAWATSLHDEQQRMNARDAAARAMLSAQGDAIRPILTDAGYSDEQIDKLAKPEAAMALYMDALRHTELAYTQARVYKDSVELTAGEALGDAWKRRAQLDLTGTVGVDLIQATPDESAAAESAVSFLRSGVSATDPRYFSAHPTGASANCASCHR